MFPNNELIDLEIPNDRPVIGVDIELMRSATGFKVDELRWVLGLSLAQWLEYTKRHPNKPISNPTVALLLRLYTAKPHLIPLPPSADPVRIMKKADISQRRLSLMLGKQATSAGKWIKEGAELSGNVRRLAKHLEDIAEDPDALAQWESMVEQEASLRGVPDIWKQQGWKPGKND